MNLDEQYKCNDLGVVDHGHSGGKMPVFTGLRVIIRLWIQGRGILLHLLDVVLRDVHKLQQQQNSKNDNVLKWCLFWKGSIKRERCV